MGEVIGFRMTTSGLEKNCNRFFVVNEIRQKSDSLEPLRDYLICIFSKFYVTFILSIFSLETW